MLMRRAGLQGVMGRPRYRRIPNMPTAGDLVDRQFHRSERNRLWVTDITEHPTQEGKVYCATVLDVFSRRVVGLVHRRLTHRDFGHQRAWDGH
jgi:putative transposase